MNMNIKLTFRYFCDIAIYIHIEYIGIYGDICTGCII